MSFDVTAPPQVATAQITARAKIGDKIYDNQRIEISYPHIPMQLLQPPARIKAVSLDLAIRGKKVGYLPGAGDSVADAIKEMGYDVTILGSEDLTTNRLKDFDAVVVGVRAFNVRNDLVSHLPALFAFVEAGGNLIEQYNRPGNDFKPDEFAPYSLRLSSDRVTDETAAVTFLAPDHPVLNTPNKITSADFDGWIQERGIYFPNQWDEHFTPILACNDPGESPLKGSLLVAHLRQRLCGLYRSGVFPRAARRRAGRLPPFCQSDFAWQMKSPPLIQPPTINSPGVPGFRTWRGVYLFVFAFFVLVVALLAIFSRWFA